MVRSHPLLVAHPGDRCLVHRTTPCHCCAIERLTPRERDLVQLAWLDAAHEAWCIAREAGRRQAAAKLVAQAPTVTERTPDGRELLSITAAAERLKVSRRTIYNFLEQGLFEVVAMPNGNKRIYAESLVQIKELSR